MPVAVSTGVLLITAIIVATLLAATIVESTLEAATSTKIEVTKMVDLILVTTLDKDGATCVAMMLRTDAIDISVKELEIAYYTEKTVSVNVTKKYGVVYEDPTTKTIILSIDGMIQPVPANSITNTICSLLDTNEAAIIWFSTKEQTKIGPGLPVLLVLKTPQTEKLIVELKTPKTPPMRVKVK
ncbi:MAG TPA: hypothetical protein EYH08_05985 [Pyrodictium sp.]|nr:hypothetical protein [Pyrodictium sp.]